MRRSLLFSLLFSRLRSAAFPPPRSHLPSCKETNPLLTASPRQHRSKPSQSSGLASLFTRLCDYILWCGPTAGYNTHHHHPQTCVQGQPTHDSPADKSQNRVCFHCKSTTLLARGFDSSQVNPRCLLQISGLNSSWMSSLAHKFISDETVQEKGISQPIVTVFSTH